MPPKFKHDFKTQNFVGGYKANTGLSPRGLSILFLILALVFISLVAFPLAKVFSGEDGWILNQGIDLFPVSPFEIPGLGTISIGMVTVRFYSMCLLGGVLAGYFLALYFAGRSGMSTSVIDKLFLGILVVSLLSARLFYVLFNLEHFQNNWLEILNLSRGGLSFFGAITGGLIYLYYYARSHKFNFFELLDILAPAVLVGQIIGRWGNFFNYEAYGASTGLFWKMFVPEAARLANNYPYENLNAEFFHPTFLYEIIPNFLLLLALLWLYDDLTKKRSGFVLGIYAVGYGIIRFFTEFFRLDALRLELPAWLQFSPIGGIVFDHLMISQIWALGLILLGVLILFKRRNILFLNKSMKEVRT